MEPVVLNLNGWSGTGKTFLLNSFATANPGAIQLLTPSRIGEPFEVAAVNWGDHAAVALDEVLMWERKSVAAGIAELEQFAEQHGKKLILVTQWEADLESNGIVLQTNPAKLRLEGRRDAVLFEYDGKKIRFPS